MDLFPFLPFLFTLISCNVNPKVQLGPNSTHHHHDYCVLGGGPAGLQMGYFLEKRGRDYIILERNTGPGSFFNVYPRHRKLISINKIYTGRRNREFNLRHDWNSLLSDRPDLLFQRISRQLYPEADDFPRYLSMYVKELGLKVRYGVDVGKIRATDLSSKRGYILTDQHGSVYKCSVLLMSTGLWVPQQVNFEGSDLVEGYESIPVDPEEYRDQAILILGKGNAAFETAQSIMGRASRVHLYSPNPVRLAWQTHYVGDLRAVNNELLDTYQLKSLDGLVEGGLEDIAIVRRERGNGGRRSGERKKARAKEGQGRGQLYLTLAELLDDSSRNRSAKVKAENLPGYHNDNFSLRQPYDRVIRCLGFRFNFSIFDGSARPVHSKSARGRLPAVTAWYEGRGTPNMFVLGTAGHSLDYRMSAGGFVHGFRYTVRAVHRVLEQRYHGNAWPATKLPTSQLLSWLLKRVNEASGPYQMFGVLGDVVLLHGSYCEYLEEFPVQALSQLPTLSGHRVPKKGLLVLVLQYGLNHTDTLGPNRAESEWTRAWRSSFLHPVLYYYDTLPTEKDMRLRPIGWPLPRPKAIHHMIEDFLTEWDQPISHSQPLRRFLENCFQRDLRTFYAESCFRFSLTSQKPPLFCRQGYLKKQGIVGNRQLWQHARDAGLMPDLQDTEVLRENPQLPQSLPHTEAAVTSAMNFDGL
ncbi:FAD-dependent oxidoreductase domain-containing protein 2 [Alosa sapidissima]|uniref:FAD-dependent oxidoreductase domain-containing protein 2 n=1 Tax=Alosa sapidissima TaxID=34773 RepID=UPI001C094E40|nr:FAD-dependent oxidoreductase domain-containing protein 2 [Alosa sapidissima]XP_041943612.1 FAD-dependent oxidoreductase domain-containing protein 2 [Alosa sapidissima]